RVVAGRGFRLGQRPQARAAGHGAGDRVHRRRRPRAGRALPSADHDPGPRAGGRGRAGDGLRPALGNRDRLRRTVDPPARSPRGAALEVPGPGAPGDLGPPVLPLRDPHPDGRGRRARRPRSRSGLFRHRPADLPPLERPAGRFFPLTPLTPFLASGDTLSVSFSAGRCPADGPGPTPAWSNQVHPLARQTRPPPPLAPTRPPPRTSRRYLIERYWPSPESPNPQNRGREPGIQPSSWSPASHWAFRTTPLAAWCTNETAGGAIRLRRSIYGPLPTIRSSRGSPPSCGCWVYLVRKMCRKSALSGPIGNRKRPLSNCSAGVP